MPTTENDTKRNFCIVYSASLYQFWKWIKSKL